MHPLSHFENDICLEKGLEMKNQFEGQSASAKIWTGLGRV